MKTGASRVPDCIREAPPSAVHAATVKWQEALLVVVATGELDGETRHICGIRNGLSCGRRGA